MSQKTTQAHRKLDLMFAQSLVSLNLLRNGILVRDVEPGVIAATPSKGAAFLIHVASGQKSKRWKTEALYRAQVLNEGTRLLVSPALSEKIVLRDPAVTMDTTDSKQTPSA